MCLLKMPVPSPLGHKMVKTRRRPADPRRLLSLDPDSLAKDGRPLPTQAPSPMPLPPLVVVTAQPLIPLCSQSLLQSSSQSKSMCQPSPAVCPASTHGFSVFATLEKRSQGDTTDPLLHANVQLCAECVPCPGGGLCSRWLVGWLVGRQHRLKT